LAEHWQLLPKGQHLVPMLVAQQTSVALQRLVRNQDAQRLFTGHRLAAPELPVPAPAWQDP